VELIDREAVAPIATAVIQAQIQNARNSRGHTMNVIYMADYVTDLQIELVDLNLLGIHNNPCEPPDNSSPPFFLLGDSFTLGRSTFDRDLLPQI
jgi:hypothetical protein